MAKIIHYIDPSADAVIILTDPLGDFAVWEYDDNDNKEGDILDLEVQRLQEAEEAEAALIALEEEEAEAALVALEEDGTHEDTNEPMSAPDTAADDSNPGEDGHEQQCGNGNSVNGSEQAAYENEIHFHVSSRHLRLPSPQFSSLLSPETWQEGIRDETDGLYHVRASEWDESALVILLNALHLRNSQVPRNVSLEMLAKIAMLVDYYACGEAITLWTEMWIARLKTTTPVPSTLCRDLMLWMCVAWVFKLPDEFANATAVAIRNSRLQELPTLGLPLVGFVDRIDQARNQAIVAILLQLRILREDFRSTKYTCPTEGRSFECGSILYGALTKELDAAGLLMSDPVGPPVGMSLLEIRSKVANIKSPVWGHTFHVGSNKYRTHSCNLQYMVAEIANRVVNGVKGLRLNDFGKS